MQRNIDIRRLQPQPSLVDHRIPFRQVGFRGDAVDYGEEIRVIETGAIPGAVGHGQEIEVIVTIHGARAPAQQIEIRLLILNFGSVKFFHQGWYHVAVVS